MLTAGEWLLEAISATSPFSSFQGSWAGWMDVMHTRPKFWKGLIKRALAWHQGYRKARVLFDGFVRGVWPAPPHVVATLAEEEHACLQCRRAFANFQSWASHASLQHGYRAMHYRAASGTRCQACGLVLACVRRYRTHLRSSRACLQSVLRADSTLLPVLELPQGHAQSRAISGRGTAHLPAVEELVSFPLLERLTLFDTASDEEIYECVVAEMESLPVLRATLRRWISQLRPGPLRDSAEDVLLCLRADLLCDEGARTAQAGHDGSDFVPLVVPMPWSPRPSGLPGLVMGGSLSAARSILDILPGGGWRPLPFHLIPGLEVDFAGALICLPKPPLAIHSLREIPSCSLRSMRRHLIWLDCCLRWIALVLRLSAAGRRCHIDLSQVPISACPVRDWLATVCTAPHPALSACFTTGIRLL